MHDGVGGRGHSAGACVLRLRHAQCAAASTHSARRTHSKGARHSSRSTRVQLPSRACCTPTSTALGTIDPGHERCKNAPGRSFRSHRALQCRSGRPCRPSAMALMPWCYAANTWTGTASGPVAYTRAERSDQLPRPARPVAMAALVLGCYAALPSPARLATSGT